MKNLGKLKKNFNTGEVPHIYNPCYCRCGRIGDEFMTGSYDNGKSESWDI